MTIRLARHLLLFVVFLSLGFSQSLADIDGQPQKLEAEELKARILAGQSKIESIYIDYRVDDPYKGNDQFPPGTFLRRIIAAKAPNLYLHETAHGSKHVTWEDDPRRRRCVVQNDQAFDIWVTQRAYNWTRSWKSDAPLPGSMPGEPAIYLLGVWPLSSRTPPQDGGHPIVLSEVAKNDQYIVRDTLEVCDGRWCHVLEHPFVDSLWVDAERAALMARQIHDDKSGALISRSELSHHKELAPGVWIPQRARLITFDFRNEEAEQQKKILTDFRMKIIEARVNDISDSMFMVSHPPGSLWLNPPKDQGLGEIQTVPNGTDHLEKLVIWAQDYLPKFPENELRSSWLNWLAALLTALGLFFLADAFLKFMNSRKRLSGQVTLPWENRAKTEDGEVNSRT